MEAEWERNKHASFKQNHHVLKNDSHNDTGTPHKCKCLTCHLFHSNFYKRCLHSSVPEWPKQVDIRRLRSIEDLHCTCLKDNLYLDVHIKDVGNTAKYGFNLFWSKDGASNLPFLFQRHLKDLKKRKPFRRQKFHKALLTVKITIIRTDPVKAVSYSLQYVYLPYTRVAIDQLKVPGSYGLDGNTMHCVLFPSHLPAGK